MDMGERGEPSGQKELSRGGVMETLFIIFLGLVFGEILFQIIRILLDG